MTLSSRASLLVARGSDLVLQGVPAIVNPRYSERFAIVNDLGLGTRIITESGAVSQTVAKLQSFV